MASWRVAAAVLMLGATLGGCGVEGPDSVDRLRIATMRDDPIFADRIEAGIADEGSTGKLQVPSYYSAAISPWFLDNPPARPTAAQSRTATIAVLDRLRGDGWILISAQCSTYPEWAVFGYRVRDGVPYTLHVSGLFAVASGSRSTWDVRIRMEAPFHGDQSVYFTPAPPRLAVPCVEGADPAHPDPDQGTIWSLRQAVAP